MPEIIQLTDIDKNLFAENLGKIANKYGLYINSIAASIKGLDKKQLAYKYEDLPIKELSEIKITGDEIMKLLNMEPGRYIKNIFDDLENSILLGNLDNDTDKIKEYLLNKYGTIL